MARGQDTAKNPNRSQREFLRIQEQILKKTDATEKSQRRYKRWTQETQSFQDDILGTITNELDKKIEIMNVTRSVSETLAETFTHNKEILESSRQILSSTELYVEQLKKSSQFIDQLVDRIPFISDEMKESYKDTIKNFFAPMVERWTDMQAHALEVWNSWGVGAKTMVGIVAVTLYGVVKIFNQLDEATEGFLKSLGTTRDEAKQLLSTSLDTYSSLAKYGISLDQSLDITQALVNEYGHMNNVSNKLQKTTAIMAQSFGMSADEAATLVKLQKEALGLSDAQVENNAKLIKASAKIYNVGAGRVARDLADSAEDVAKFSSAGMESIIKSAAYARRLGTSFKEIATIAESLLDIETSTSASMQVQVLTGKTINLEYARNQALLGNIQNANKNILEQLGSYAELSTADYFTKKAISELLGTDTQTWMTMLKNQEEMNKLSKDTRKIYEQFLGVSLADSLELDKTLGAWSKLKAQMSALFVPILMPIVEGLTWMVEKLADGLDLLNNAGWMQWKNNMNGAGKAITGIVVSLGGLFVTMKLLKGAMGIFKGGGIVGSILGKGAGGGVKIGFGLLKAALGIAALGGALIVVGKGLQMFKDIGFKEVGAMVASLAGLGAVGAVLGAFAAPVLIGAAALGALGGALTITAIAAEKFANAIYKTPAESIARVAEIQKNIDMSHMKSEMESVVDPVRELNKEFSELNKNILQLNKLNKNTMFEGLGSTKTRSKKTEQPIKVELKLDNKVLASAMKTIVINGD